MKRVENSALLRLCFSQWTSAREAGAHRLELQKAHEAVSELWRSCQSRLEKDASRAQTAEAVAQRFSTTAERALASAWQSRLSERCFLAWHVEARGWSENLVANRAVAQRSAVVE